MTAAVAYLEPPTHADPQIPDGHVGTLELVRRSGISYRQADYWTRTEILRADHIDVGSSYPRTYPAEEVAVAALIRQLTADGIHPRRAEPAARELLATGHTTLAGIRLELPQENP